MPSSRASVGVRASTLRPSTSISPDVRLTTPAITLVRVDLPAPFSPTMACTSPGSSSKSTSSIAGTPAYFLVALRSARIAVQYAAHDAARLACASAIDSRSRRAPALAQQVEPAVTLDRGDDAVVLAVEAAVQRVANQALLVEADHQPVRARRRPRLDDAHRLQVCALHRLEVGVARGQRRRDPVARIDLLQHALAKRRLAQHELDQLRAQREAGEPPAAARRWRDARRIAR